jgi:hypothetical protein
VAQDVMQSSTDWGQLAPMIDPVQANLRRKPEQPKLRRLHRGTFSRFSCWLKEIY